MINKERKEELQSLAREILEGNYADELTPGDIDRLVFGVPRDERGRPEPFDTDFGADLANLCMIAVELSED